MEFVITQILIIEKVQSTCLMAKKGGLRDIILNDI